MRTLTAVLAAALLSACTGPEHEFDTYVQVTREASSQEVDLIVMVTPSDWEDGGPDVGMATFSLDPGETETQRISNNKIPGRRYTVIGSLSTHEIPVISVATRVYDGDKVVFRAKQEFVSHGL